MYSPLLLRSRFRRKLFQSKCLQQVPEQDPQQFQGSVATPIRDIDIIRVAHADMLVWCHAHMLSCWRAGVGHANMLT